MAQIVEMCLKHQKRVIIVCGINTVSAECMEAKFTEEERRLITVLDLTSRYGQAASMEQTKDCLAKMCLSDIKSVLGHNDTSTGAL